MRGESVSPEGIAEEGSVTRQLAELRRGNPDAPNWLARRLLPELRRLAQRSLRGGDARAFDHEDVAVEVLQTLLSGVHRFRRLENRQDLEQLMIVLVRRRAIDAYRKARRRRRHEVGESWLPGPIDKGNLGLTRRTEVPPDEVISEVLDSIRAAIRGLEDDELQTTEILRLKLAGYSVPEIASLVGRGERAIYRLLERLKARFQELHPN